MGYDGVCLGSVDFGRRRDWVSSFLFKGGEARRYFFFFMAS
jgi:hypothetical protein